MKDQSNTDAGTIAALMVRFKDVRLPRTQGLLEKVNAGQKLDDGDIDFLKRVYNDSRNLRPLIERNPEYLSMISKFIDLYSEIVAKAIELEK
jgi:hypothetical protein